MNINIHIEKLILHDLPIPHSQRPLLQAAVEAELARLVTNDGLATSLLAGGAVPKILASNIQLTQDSNSTLLGQQIAQAVYGGLGQ
ncbi:hypothetical protein [Iningainema tapete]|uniref:Uncharacterized protein n=1 Tax=Iningainema tapete BLCC-T55 TaxID=2748662 RepID=A0A8J6XFX7_9CYAN|nr:hypothetical protein [Iningainema tapete]MBD2773378.1 hypothetical protein [Iningainema tapete BLCC-T55]